MKEIAEEECNEYVFITQEDIIWEITGNSERERCYSFHFHPLSKKMLILADGASLKIWITVLI
jgi:hypothetical protein